ncbi:hypothetical protein ASF68_18030 [Plantibacter sp. Leaf314]|nr:hypothetical protein ASF68_18030 [Plantibacter sp. Leaf314]
MRLSHADAEYLRTLREATEHTLRDAIGDTVDVALLDAPNQTNVGDSLIWAGEIAYFRRLGLRIRYIADIATFDPAALRRAMPSGVVLLHGGGNFGDLWMGHQNHRERIVKELPDYRVVQLSQSIYFASEARAAQADEIIGKHPDFRLLLRDSLSMERAAKQLPSLQPVFCQDMALGFDPPAQERSARGTDVLVIARRDKEAMSGLHDVGDDWGDGLSVTSTDWHSEGWLAVRYRTARRLMKLHHFLVRVRRRLGWTPTLPQWAVQRLITSLNVINITGALRWYAAADIVVVDRLHAHVLALLLGIDHVALDNNYRKIGAVFDDYTGRFSTANYATDTAVAKATVQSLTAL